MGKKQKGGRQEFNKNANKNKKGSNPKAGKAEKGGMKGAGKSGAPAGATKTSSGKSKYAKFTSIADMEERLRGSQFRMINEMLYTTTGSDAYSKFQEDPSLFEAYHHGYAVQVSQWPEDPLDRIINDIKKIAPKDGKKTPLRVADMGCGVGRLGKTLNDGKRIAVHSFDLIAANENVTACNIAHVPLENNSVDVVVFCLSLMGTDFSDFIKEAWRILVKGGSLKVAEAKSRIENVKAFVNGMKELGFEHVSTQDDNTMFILFEFKKGGSDKKPKTKKVNIKLKPCLYKRR